MPIYSKSEFAKICGVTNSAVSMNIKRGNLVVTNNSIDSNKEVNRYFMERHIDVVPPVDVVPEKRVAPPKVRRPLAKKKPVRTIAQEDDFESEKRVTNKMRLDNQLKELQVEKAEQDVELNKIKIAKQRGEVIPTSLVRVVVGQMFKGVTVAFHQGCDNFISSIAKKTGMSRIDQAKLRSELIDIVNQAVKDGQQENKESINHIVNEYKETRGVGERR